MSSWVQNNIEFQGFFSSLFISSLSALPKAFLGNELGGLQSCPGETRITLQVRQLHVKTMSKQSQREQVPEAEKYVLGYAVCWIKQLNFSWTTRSCRWGLAYFSPLLWSNFLHTEKQQDREKKLPSVLYYVCQQTWQIHHSPLTQNWWNVVYQVIFISIPWNTFVGHFLTLIFH